MHQSLGKIGIAADRGIQSGIGGSDILKAQRVEDFLDFGRVNLRYAVISHGGRGVLLRGADILAVDLIFAVDSVPAIFAITTDPFIVYTSNIFAILGLRSLYFALAAMIHRFRYLKYALAGVLVFIGCKIFLVGIIGKFPAWLSLSVLLYWRHGPFPSTSFGAWLPPP
jgi:hypothetical protein